MCAKGAERSAVGRDDLPQDRHRQLRRVKRQRLTLMTLIVECRNCGHLYGIDT
jgi:hypothetical protein